jgi:hypothetical protein
MKTSSTNIRQKAMNKARPDRFMRNEETVASSNPARVRQNLQFIQIKFVNYKKD